MGGSAGLGRRRACEKQVPILLVVVVVVLRPRQFLGCLVQANLSLLCFPERSDASPEVNRSGDARYPVRTEPLPTTLIVALYRRIEA
jgi:hypothetical protein